MTMPWRLLMVPDKPVEDMDVLILVWEPEPMRPSAGNISAI